MTRKDKTATRGWRGMLLDLRINWRLHGLRGRCWRHADAALQIPDSIRQRWLDEAGEELPGWQPDEADWVIAASALMQFFDCCRLKTTAAACALPSKAADSVWHLWLKHDPAGLAEFQQRWFGQVLPHQEASELGTDLETALAQSWTVACRSERLSPLGRGLPLMFAADHMLRAPGGWAYAFDYRGQVIHRNLDPAGRQQGRGREHPGLTLASFVGLGLLSPQEVSWAERRKRACDGGGGAACGSSGDGGCSCGSSCGSGCGGGGCGS